MRILLTLAALTATPAMAHGAADGVHIPHGAYLLAVVVGVVAFAAYKFTKR